jgi:fructose-1-phosphate kinase PfkB-like protein/YHS domain-containing protein
MIGTITVNPSIDHHLFIDKLVKDDAIRARDTRRDPGGKGINVSRVIKELGGATTAFGMAGGCAGYMLKSLMAEKGIPFEAIELPQESRINVIITDRSDRTQTRISAAGPRLPLADMDLLVDKVLSYSPPPEWWVLGGTLPPGAPNDLYVRLIRELEARSKVGAGDSFLAGCVLALSQELSIEEALRLGMAAGTAAVMNEGTQLCRKEDVERLLPGIKIEAVELPPARAAAPARSLVRDVICGMEVDPALTSFTARRGGREYHFCSLKCQEQFRRSREAR